MSTSVSTTRAEVIPLPSREAVTAAAADALVAAAVEAIAARGRFLLVLSGGSTPKALYELLATPAYAARIDWTRTHVFWGDERCVPPDDRSSNYRMAREALLDRVPIPPASIHRMRGEDPPQAAADAYQADLRQVCGPGTPRFDVVLLGMGDNGHTASLFPNLTAVRETSRWVVAEYVGEVKMWRITMTPPLLNAAARVLFLVVGADKAPMLKRVLEGPRDVDALPAQVVSPTDGVLLWLIDQAAAAALTRS
jgi:6-phosphogluconolactonase